MLKDSSFVAPSKKSRPIWRIAINGLIQIGLMVMVLYTNIWGGLAAALAYSAFLVIAGKEMLINSGFSTASFRSRAWSTGGCVVAVAGWAVLWWSMLAWIYGL